MEDRLITDYQKYMYVNLQFRKFHNGDISRRTLIELIEKVAPTKPKIIKYGDGRTFCYCPRCAWILSVTEEGQPIAKRKKCSCGQSLDWSEGND